MDDTRDEVDEILAGMTGGRTGTAGGVSSPVPPAADWARGLDAASASAARLTVLLSDVYRAHQGKDLFCFNVCSTGSAVFFRSVG